MNIDEQEMLKKMLIVFKPDGRDWMGIPITKNNVLSFHHIIKRKNGLTIVDNGALLTKRAHRKLNILESHNNELFELWQNLFISINETMSPPNDEHKALMKEYMQLTNECLYEKDQILKKRR